MPSKQRAFIGVSGCLENGGMDGAPWAYILSAPMHWGGRGLQMEHGQAYGVHKKHCLPLWLKEGCLEQQSPYTDHHPIANHKRQ